MPMNEFGKKLSWYRQEHAMTQEELASRIGVTAQAVSKWERGLAFPDIMLLAPLARILGVDINTLLSFQEKLSEEEIGQLTQEVCHTVTQQGAAAGFALAKAKIREYPNCRELILQLAASLQGFMLFDPQGTEQGEDYEKEICKWYEDIAESEDAHIREKANEMLFYQHIAGGEYEKAETALQRMPREGEAYKQAEINLYMKQGRSAEAKVLLEQQLLAAAGKVQSALSGLQVIALKEEDVKKARLLADTCSSIVKTLELWEYGTYSTYLELYSKEQDVEGCARIFEGMLACAEQPWELKKTALYRDIPQKEREQYLPGLLRADLLDLIRHEEILAFFRESAEGKAFLAKWEEQEEQ